VPEHVPSPPDDDLTRTWHSVRSELRAEVPDMTFHIWLEPLELAARRGTHLFVRAPDHIRTWVEERYLPLLAGAATKVLGSKAQLEIVDADWAAEQDDQHAHDAPPVAGPPGDASFLNPKYTFEQFVIGDGNRLAHGAALAVAEQPGQTYNPLFIQGPPGLGKTHLLHAIGNYVRAYGGGLTVRYATAEMFTTEYVTASRGGGMRDFHDRFRQADVLLIDDVQFLAEKTKTREEFFHTFNSLYEAGSQLVLTSDRPPGELDALESRLRERFACGLIAELEPPSLEVRMAILRTRARLDALHGVPDDTLAEIARHVSSSVRALEGALIRVVAYASLRGDTPTPDLARALLARLYPPTDESGAPTLAAIQTATAEAMDVSRDELLAQDRRPKVAMARQVAMYLARELTDESLPAIGREFGGRNHSTVMHAHRRIKASVASDANTARVVDGVRDRLGQAPQTG
jgi:chromosomal replication initiator protein